MPALDLATRLLGVREQGVLRNLAGGALGLVLRAAGSHRHETVRLEYVHGLPLLVLPSVFNPRLLRTGAFFASVIAHHKLGSGTDVLDLGTGTGICALHAARHARQVTAVDINPQAVRCATLNAQLNELRVDCRHGDLFDPVDGQRFGTVFFNPPFIIGPPADARDCAWRSPDVAERFAGRLAAHLAPGGRAYLLLSTFGDACASFVDHLAERDYTLAAVASRRYVNERVTVIEVTPPAAGART